MPSLQREGAEIHYEVHGSGPAVAFVHGAGGNALSWWQQVPHFARDHTVITLDHRGFGRSRAATGAEHGRHFAGDLRAVLDAAGVGRAALVCQSMGGWTGMHFTLAHPERVRCLVLSGTPGGVVAQGVQDAMAALGREMLARGGRPLAFDESHPALAPDAATRDPERAFLYLQIDLLNPPAAVLRTGLGEIPVSPERLAGFTTPVLMVAGERDRVFPVKALREVAALIPGASLVTIPVAGHSPYFEAPEAFNRIVRGFLTLHA